MTARDRGFSELALPDMERRMANTVRHGKVMEVNHATRRVRVKSGEIETDWIPWPAGRAAAGKRRWDPPEVGEQVTMLSPGGDFRQAVVIPGVYQTEYDAPSSDPNKDTTEYGDGTVIEYDRGTHTLRADLGDSKMTMTREAVVIEIGAAKVTMTASGTTWNGPVLFTDPVTYEAGMTGSNGADINGTLTVTGGDIVNNSKSVGSTHTHVGVSPGGGVTGVPS